MNTHIYGRLVALIGVIHLFFLSQYLNLITYLIVLIPIGLIMILLFKQVKHLNGKINSSFFICHILIVLLYVAIKPSFYYFIPLAIFICTEVLRLLLARELVMVNKQIISFEKEREQFNETFKIVRSERHDFLKHISAIHFMLEKKKNEEAKNYLDDLVGKYEETNLSIKGEKGVVAGILNDSYRRASKLGISLFYDFDVPISSLPLSDQDLVSLIGNVLANSIEACEQWQIERNEQALLSLEFYKRSGLYILTCKNQSLPIPTDILDQLYQSFGLTTKDDTHDGLGTKVISEIVKKYGGFLDFTYKQEEFLLKIKFPALT
ncbi:sensor histidine kinase [Bacillaceae bacterium W0354]